MRTVAVSAADRTQWTVRVVWEPRWRALARRFGGWRRDRRDSPVDLADGADAAGQIGGFARSAGGRGGGGGDFDLGDAVSVIAFIFIVFVVAGLFFWWVLLPLLLLVIDLLVVLVLLVAATAGRVLLGRPWTVEARAGSGRTVREEVVGWRAALRRRDEMARAIRETGMPIRA
jgi:hypothetical protein